MKQKKNTEKAEKKTEGEIVTDNIAEQNATVAPEQEEAPATPKAVSYTHLDVYKRQGHHPMRLQPNEPGYSPLRRNFAVRKPGP